MQVGICVLFMSLALTEWLGCSLGPYRYLTFELFLNVPLNTVQGFRETSRLLCAQPWRGGDAAAG